MTGQYSRGRATLRAAAVAIGIVLLAVGCASAAPTSPARTGAGPAGPSIAASPSSAAAAPRPTPGRTVPATPTPVPFPSTLPGLAGWTVISPGAVQIATSGDTIALTLTRRALWFQAQRGVLVGQPVTGDFRITATLRATDRAGVPLATRTDGLVQLGGLMARADNAARENYVFVVVGTDANDLSVETKSTTDSASRFDGPSWPAASADLRLCRVGATFTAWKRPAATSGAWVPAATYQRPDLPATLLVGPNIYSSGEPDLVVTFEKLRIEPVVAAADCGRP